MTEISPIAPLNLVQLPFLRQEGDAGQRTSTYNCCYATFSSWCTTAALASKSVRSLANIEHVWVMMNRELTISPEPATGIAKFRQRVRDTWDNLSQDDIRHLYDPLHATIHDCVAARGGYAVYWCHCLGTSYCDMCFIWSEFVSIYPYKDKLPVT